MSSTEAATTSPGFAARAKGWAAVGRIPFLSVGILPYLLGVCLAWWSVQALNVAVVWLGLAGVVSIMLATYLNGEWADVIEDRVSTGLGRSPFAGGSGAVVDGVIPAKWTWIAAAVAAALAMAVGLLLAFGYRTGVWTIPLGVIGLAAGYYYSAPPFRWVERGIGELLIGVCYGWLPIAVGYYLQTGELPAQLLLISLPVAFTIFNVIYANEYPDFEGDAAAGKRNLLQRIGRERGVWIYAVAVAAAFASGALGVLLGVVPGELWPWYTAVTVLALVPTAMLLAGAWRTRAMLVPICGLTIVVNLATTGVLIAAFWPKG